jgi:transcriptional regulator with XRE-family HTH domain
VEQFGSYLRSLRAARGLSRPELRDQIRDRFGDARGISTKTLENWEGGKIDGMSAGALARLVVVLEADYEDVFSKLVAAQLASRDAHAPGAGAPDRGAGHEARGQRQRRSGSGSKRRSP